MVRIEETTSETVDRSTTTPRRTTDKVATCELVVRDDPEHGDLRLEIPKGRHDDVAASISLQPDGRLLSVNATSTAKGGRLLEGVVGAVATVGATALGFVAAGPAGALTGAAAATAAARSLKKGPGDEGQATSTAAEASMQVGDEPTPQMLVAAGISSLFKGSQPDVARALYWYRVAIKNLLLHHATLAASTTPLAEPQSADPADVVSATWKAICRLDKIIESTRRQAQPLEAVYQAWVAERRETRSWVKVTEIPVGELGGAEAATSMRDRVPGELRERWQTDALSRGLLVTFDRDETPTRSGSDAPSRSDAVRITYRSTVSGRLGVWKVSTFAEPRISQDLPDPVENVRVDRISEEPIQALLRGTERTITLGLDAFRDGEIALDFTTDGALAKVTGKSQAAIAQAAELLSSLPETVSSAVERGQKIATRLVPGAARQEWAERQLAITKAETDRDDLLAEAPADPLTSLKARVARQELLARLAVAEATVRNPDAAIDREAVGGA